MKAPAPKSLTGDGVTLWRDVTADYDLRPDELSLLEQACRTLDVIGMLEAAWSEFGFPMVTTGSMGQEVIHPLIGELRSQRASFERLRAALKLPDDTSSVPVESTSDKARRAAQARWSRGA